MKNISVIFSSILNSYSQIFFSKNKIFASFLFIVSFLDPWLGVAGLISVIVANGLAETMGFNKLNVRDGIYGFNPLLTGLAVGVYFAASWQAIILVIFIAIMTLLVSLVLQGVLAKYGLPFLSLPFLFVVWLITLAFPEFSNLGINLKDIYTSNQLYSIGGLKLVEIYNWINNIAIFPSLKTYFLSLGAIFFQYNILAGFLIAVGLIIYSRQAFLMSLIGFYGAYLFYSFLGVPHSSLDYTYFGFNFILSAIAIGSFFIVPSFKSLVWTLLIIPILVLITIGTDKIFSKFFLSIYSLPFNMVVLGFIYALKIRTYQRKGLKFPVVQQKTPELNTYFHKISESRNFLKFGIKFSLPFFGKWAISQGVDGEHTHKDAWRHAWDFVITDNNKNQYHSNGNILSDYYCYDKPILAPADGTVVEIIDGIADNKIGEVNLKQNWGNSIVIQHGAGIYSQCSHIKIGTFKVIKGMYIKRGQHLANVGSSGRSPYPHLHFQFQNSQIVGSKTIEVQLNNIFIFGEKNQEFRKSSIPKKNDIVSNIEPMPALKKLLRFVPGSEYIVNVENNKKKKTSDFIADVDFLNNPYLYSKKDKSTLFFNNDNSVFNALNYTGKTNSALFLMFNSLYFISLGVEENVSFKDEIPLHFNHNKLLVLLQDFFVNIKIFLTTKYQTKFISVDDQFNPSKIVFETEISDYFFNYKINTKRFSIEFNTNNFSTIELKSKKNTTRLSWKRKT